jgi:hypothetical protein
VETTSLNVRDLLSHTLIYRSVPNVMILYNIVS